MVGVPGLEPGTSSLSGTRSNQLSYTPIIMVELKGLEPLTPCVQSRCSSQLSYSPSKNKLTVLLQRASLKTE